MGSTGTDRFSDYPGTRGDQGGSSGVGGSSGEEQCDRAFATALEEVERCAFFQQYKDVPHRGTSVSIKLGQRIIVVESNTNETIGYLPTQFNYLAGYNWPQKLDHMLRWKQ